MFFFCDFVDKYEVYLLVLVFGGGGVCEGVFLGL